MNWATSARAILVRPGGGYRSRIRYFPVPGPFTRRVGRTSVQSSALARTTRSISRTSAKGLAKSDRRRVVIRLMLEAALRDVASVFLPMMRDWQQMAARYSDDELRLIVDFYDRMEGVLREHLTRLREAGRDPG